MYKQAYTFTRDQRLRKKADFDAVFARRQRSFQGPLGVYVSANGLDHSRMGISMSRRVGIAARRNRIKRLLRESFRLLQHQLPSGFDIVLVPKPHEPLALQQYQELLRAALAHACGRAKSGGSDPCPAS
jgi:ribonuclease P protein component